MILSWSGTRLQHAINDGNSHFFQQERDKALTVLRSRGVIHCDSEWRNMLWDDLSGRLAVTDLEDVKWLKRARALESVSANTRRTRCLLLKRIQIAVVDSAFSPVTLSNGTLGIRPSVVFTNDKSKVLVSGGNYKHFTIRVFNGQAELVM
ncbi:hypothetical protein CBS147353_11720 [Aspergillus niger]|nr:hypothetical protein CBS147353_11720 [Aspergillus niger]